MLQGGLFAYGDTRRYRLGVNRTRRPEYGARVAAAVKELGGKA